MKVYILTRGYDYAGNSEPLAVWVGNPPLKEDIDNFLTEDFLRKVLLSDMQYTDLLDSGETISTSDQPGESLCLTKLDSIN